MGSVCTLRLGGLLAGFRLSRRTAANVVGDGAESVAAAQLRRTDDFQITASRDKDMRAAIRRAAGVAGIANRVTVFLTCPVLASTQARPFPVGDQTPTALSAPSRPSLSGFSRVPATAACGRQRR